MYDQVLFLVPIIAILAQAAHRPRLMSRGVLFIAGLTAIHLFLHGVGLREFTFVWHAPFCLVLYLLAVRWLRQTQSAANNS